MPDPPFISAWIRAAYADMDFTPALQSSEFIPLEIKDQPRSSSDWSGFAQVDLGYTDLTKAEERIVGMYRMLSGDRFSCRLAMSYAINFYEQYGRPPCDGTDLLALYTAKWTTPGGVARFKDLSVSEMLSRGAWRCINPATGRFYDSFSSTEWSQFGILVEPVAGEGAVKAIPGGVWDESTQTWVSGMVAYKMWHVVIYGEQPGSVLIDKEIGREVGTGERSGSGLCRCN